MRIESTNDNWAASDAYEAFMGRWSRLLADKFLDWLDFKPGHAWLDVGCGTGALVSAVCRLADPSLVVACDPSESFIKYAKEKITDPRAKFMVAGINDLPGSPGGFDCVVSGLVLNFLPEPGKSVKDMRDCMRRKGTLAAYVWDYAGRMEYLRFFWDEAVGMDPSARELDEGVRFPVCKPGELEQILHAAGLQNIRSSAIEIPIRLETFSEYWQSFLGGTGPAPSYVASLDVAKKTELRNRLQERLALGERETVTLVARAWAVSGMVL